jgi:hypothetical protein
VDDPDLTQMVREIYQRGGALADDLRAKCRWEQITPSQALTEYPEFVRRHRAALPKEATDG